MIQSYVSSFSLITEATELLLHTVAPYLASQYIYGKFFFLIDPGAKLAQELRDEMLDTPARRARFLRKIIGISEELADFAKTHITDSRLNDTCRKAMIFAWHNFEESVQRAKEAQQHNELVRKNIIIEIHPATAA